MLRYLLLLLFPLMFFTCVQPGRLIEQGEYARALKVSSNQLRQGRIKAAELGGLETSFFLLTQQDSQQIADMRATGRPDVWPDIYRKAERIDRRQMEVFQLLHELDKADYHPSVSFYPAKALLEEAAEKSALYHYANAQEFIPAARAGDRYAARLAYEQLDNSLGYVASFKDAEILLDEMMERGTTHLLLHPRSHPRWDTFDPRAIDELFWGHDFPERQDWLVVHLEPETAPRIDYEADFYFSDLSVSPDRESRSDCSTSKEIEDGFTIKKVWSEKDSAYVEVKEVKYKTISAMVSNFLQEKEAEASVRITIINARTYEPESNDVVWGSADWSNEYSKSSGDSRALPGGCSSVIGMCAMFPSDGSMLAEAVADLKGGFWRSLEEVENY